ncbi:MAG: class I SAM-dependent methyltransferase [Spirosomataceae bacterium]
MIKAISKGALRRHMFEPTWLGLILNPFFIARRGLYLHIKALSGNITGQLLDVGCGRKPYQTLFSNATNYIGLEIDTPENRRDKNADFFYDGVNFPFERESFDAVLANQVFEHVFNPDEFLENIWRVLKPNGVLLLTVPFVWDEHEQPFDYARYSSFGLKHILQKHGFSIIEHRKSVTSVAAFFQLLNGYFYKKTLFLGKGIYLTVVPFLMFPLTCLGLVLGIILPKNNDFFLDNIILVQKKI